MPIASIALNDALQRLRSLVRGDGADLRPIGIHDGAHILELGLDITDVVRHQSLGRHALRQARGKHVPPRATSAVTRAIAPLGHRLVEAETG